MSNFIILCGVGHVQPEEIDDFIDKWHDGVEGKMQSLAEYLGMSTDEYGGWLRGSLTVEQIIKARKGN